MATIVGNYELVTQLAVGGMAETHVARSLVDGSVVVVKLLLPRYAGNAEFVEMFVDEGRVISSLRHPNVVAMREFGFHNEQPYLAMEYLHGVDLRTLTRTLIMRRRQHMPPDVALFIAASMCAGLHHAHQARTIDGKPMDITHRDVSPQNVVLTFDGQVKLIDFGIATARGRMHETRSGALKGKIPYMAPEQVRAGDTDRRTDIYATGVVLYEMLTARRPYLGKRSKMGEFSLMMAIVNHEVVPLDTVRDLPIPLAAVVMKAFAADPARRYQSADEMQAAIVGIAHQLGFPLAQERLAMVMTDVFGARGAGDAARTSEQVIKLVSEVSGAKTKVDETHDPMAIEQSELIGVASTGRVSVTDRRPPTFDDLHASDPAIPAVVMPPAEPPIAEREADRAAPAIDKVVEQNVTRLRFHRAVEVGFRWNRLLDGLEGVVEVDFTAITEDNSPSTASVADALRGLGNEVSEIRLLAVPIPLAVQLEDRCYVVSASCRGRCPRCQRWTAAVLPYDELRARLASGELPCPRCGTGLVEMELGSTGRAPSPMPAVPTLVGRAAEALPPAAATIAGSASAAGPAAPLAGSASGKTRTTTGTKTRTTTGAGAGPATPAKPPTAPRPAVAARASVGWYAAIVIGSAAAAAAVAVGVTWKLRARSGPTAPPRPAVVVGPNDWTVELDEANVRAAPETLASLRGRATQLAILDLEAGLPPAIKGLAAPADAAGAGAGRCPVVDLGLEEVETRSDTAATPRTSARYRIPETVRATLRARYGEVRSVFGLELANAPPSQPRGVVVVGAPPGSTARAGDRVVSIGGRPVEDLASLPPDTGRDVELVIEHVEQKTLTVPRGGAP